ncbi:MAG: 2-amino-5-formylamino-6-ribosylaminopyrimidin-4(3H)-one 5'-monophosphate deformylase [archaeon]|nr:2-amino-5-formylamino-6-ribosylaminopyrimidin-4(3H)-one 5'-monophosphate deformylase [archaeon]
MVELRLNAGNIISPDVHKIGVIALGSHLENHGPALPIDTDAKIASYIAFNASLESGAKYLGVIYPAHEIDEIHHGIHNSLEEVSNEIINVLNSAKKFLSIDKVIIINGHGGNLPIVACLNEIEDKTGLLVTLNSKIIESEGPHGGTGELSMAKVLGILNEEEVKNQDDTRTYGEIGLSAFKEARANDPNIEEGARDIEENGVYVDEDYGKQLLNLAINSVLLDIQKLLDSY